MGCGRYVQEAGALAKAGEEVQKITHGCSSAFIIAGPVALKLCGEKLFASLEKAGVKYYVYTYTGFCNPRHGDEILAMPELKEYTKDGLVIGVGGGNIMDIAKYVAANADVPLLNIPTSSATCAACTPLSVLYDDNNAYIKSQQWPCEIAGVLVDMDVLITEPARLMVSGLFDSVAKLPELGQRLNGITTDEMDIGLKSSAVLSDFLSQRLYELLPQAASDLKNGIQSKAFYDVVYLAIGLTGVVSGLARGVGQTALAHKIYEMARTYYPMEVKDYLHGEIVAIGLLVQNYYNGKGNSAEADAFREKLSEYHMPLSLSELGLPHDNSTVDTLYNAIAGSTAMAGTSDEDKKLLKKAIEYAL